MKMKYMKKCLLLIGFFIAQANVKEIDLHGQRIGSWNIECVYDELTTKNPDKQNFKLILSDNIINDEGIEILAKILTSDRNKFAEHLVELDLSNNRISNESFISLVMILKECSNLKWINISINNLDVNDFEKFLDKMNFFATYGDEEENKKMAQKIVWLPRSYNVDRFFSKSEPFYIAHVEYYGQHQAKEHEKVAIASS